MIQKIITICNAKGGVGKTTSTASIGACMALMGKKVLLIDLDGQANLTLYYIPNDSEIEVSIFDSLISGEPLPIINVKENLDIVPSSLEMARPRSLRFATMRLLLLRKRRIPLSL